MQFLTKYFLFTVLLLGFTACSSPSTRQENENNPGAFLTITNSVLKQNASHLTGTLTVYPENKTDKLTQANLLFAEDNTLIFSSIGKTVAFDQISINY